MSLNVYTYDVRVYDECLRLYALDEQNQSIVLQVQDYKPHMFYKLPNTIKWDKDNVKLLKEEVSIQTRGISENNMKMCSMFPLYFVHEKKQPFLKVYFDNIEQYNELIPILKRKHLKLEDLTLKPRETDIPVTIQFLSRYNIPSAGWVEVQEKSLLKETKHYKEYIVSCKDIKAIDKEDIPTPCVLTFDLEVYSSRPHQFPCASLIEDVIFQISCIISGSKQKNILLTLGKVESDGTFEVIECKGEAQLISKFAAIINEYNPHVITGWNILGFDFTYLIERMGHYEQLYRRRNPLFYTGVLDDLKCEHVNDSWSSGAYGQQNLNYVDMHGRIILDLLVYARREIKADNYKLDTIAGMYLKVSKDPVTAQDIFNSYKAYLRQSPDAGKQLSTVGKYCIKDSVLVKDLFGVFQAWVGICEMANVCNVSPWYIYMKGQQIKVQAQVYKYCYNNKIVAETKQYQIKDYEQYQGAHVMEPKPGIYNYVVPFDFSSLYPTVMIAYNIDYMSFVDDTIAPHIKDEDCNVVEWLGEPDEETKEQYPYRYRFKKEPKGVLPSIAENLLEARAKTRKFMKTIDKNSTLYNILNKRQLSYKVSCNSLYGATGARTGKVSLMPAAMCITALGRQNLQKAANHLINRYHANLIYQDTDSCYVNFDNIPPEKLWQHSVNIEKEMVKDKIFPDPMVLEFEEAVYDPFLILSKKRYMWKYYTEDGERPNKIGTKGVLLSRRDNCGFIREIYRKVVDKIFNKTDKNTLIQFIVNMCTDCLSGRIPFDDFIITKKVNPLESYKGYNPNIPKTLEKLPAHVQLAAKMQKRGDDVEFNQRLEYMITDLSDVKDKLCNKVESPEFVKTHRIIQIDYLYYIKWLSTQMDEMLSKTYHINIMKEQYKIRLAYQKCMREVRNYFTRVYFIE